MQAGPLGYREGAVKSVLVDVCGAIDPGEGLYEKVGRREQDKRRLAEDIKQVALLEGKIRAAQGMVQDGQAPTSGPGGISSNAELATALSASTWRPRSLQRPDTNAPSCEK